MVYPRPLFLLEQVFVEVHIPLCPPHKLVYTADDGQQQWKGTVEQRLSLRSLNTENIHTTRSLPKRLSKRIIRASLVAQW